MVLRSIRFSLLFVFFICVTQTVFSALDEFKEKEKALRLQIDVVDHKIFACIDARGAKNLKAALVSLDLLQKEFNHLVFQLKSFYQTHLNVLLELEVEEEKIPTKEEFEQAVELADCKYEYEKRMKCAQKMNDRFYKVAPFVENFQFSEKQKKVELALDKAKNNYSIAELLFKKEQYKRIIQRRKELKNIL